MLGGQLAKTCLHHFKKLAAAHVLHWVALLRRRFLVVPVGFEGDVIQGIADFVFAQWGGAYLAAVVAQRVNHLVLEDAHQPSFELRAVAKGLGFGQGGQYGLWYNVFSPDFVAQLKACKL